MKFCDTCNSSYPVDFVTCPKDQSALRAMTDFMPGLVLRGKYEIIEKVGSGGMGAVYKARHLAFGEIRAIKFLGSHLATDEGWLQRFRSEAVLARKLHHPNVVRVEDLDSTEDGRPFIVMEYVEGRSLRSAIRNGGALSLARAVDIATQVCSALAAAHSIGILHRDIKPDNMVLVRDSAGREQVKVLDFGLAKVIEGFEGGSLQVATGTGMLVGTPQYLSPEQAMPSRGLEPDGRSDLYALGVVLYEMLTGVLPFHADTRMGMLLEHIQTQATPPDEAFPGRRIPRALSDIVMKALEKHREHRFGSAEEMGQALKDALTALPSAADGPEPRRAPAPGSSDASPLAVPTPATKVVMPGWARAATTALRPASGTPATPAAPATRGAPATPATPATPSTPATPAGHATTRAPRPMTRPSLPAAAAPSISMSSVGLVAALILGLAWLAMSRSGAKVPAPEASIPPSPPPVVQMAPPSMPAANTPTLTDDALAAEVRQAFFFSQPLRDARIEVVVKNGLVMLTGDVPDAMARDTAVTLAANVNGVRRVMNSLRIPAASPSPPAVSDDPPEALPVQVATPVPQRRRPDPKVHELLDRARREIDTGNHEGAAKLFEEVLKIEPDNAVAKEALERARSHPPPPRR